MLAVAFPTEAYGKQISTSSRQGAHSVSVVPCSTAKATGILRQYEARDRKSVV